MWLGLSATLSRSLAGLLFLVDRCSVSAEDGLWCAGCSGLAVLALHILGSYKDGGWPLASGFPFLACIGLSIAY